MISPLGFASLRGIIIPPPGFAPLRGTALVLALGCGMLAGCASLGVGGEPIEVQLVADALAAFEHRRA
jgi:hypothetical protein